MDRHTLVLGEQEGAAAPSAPVDAMERRARYFEVRELVTIGIFSAVIRVSSLLVALIGGGMNPLTLILKNLVFTSLLVVMLHKVRKFGALTLFIAVNTLVSMLLMGGSVVLLPAMLAAGLVAEGIILLLGGYGRTMALMLGVAAYDILFKVGSLGVSWLYAREQPQMLVMASIFIAVGYLGSLAGLFAGSRFVRELRHAGIVRD